MSSVFFMLNISQVILMRTDSNLCRKELTVHWSAPNSLIRSYLQPCTNSMWGDESEAVAPIIWLYQIVDAQKEEVFIPELLITLRSYVPHPIQVLCKQKSLVSEKNVGLLSFPLLLALIKCGQTVQLPKTWGTMPLIWRHCNGHYIFPDVIPSA